MDNMEDEKCEVPSLVSLSLEKLSFAEVLSIGGPLGLALWEKKVENTKKAFLDSLAERSGAYGRRFVRKSFFCELDGSERPILMINGKHYRMLIYSYIGMERLKSEFPRLWKRWSSQYGEQSMDEVKDTLMSYYGLTPHDNWEIPLGERDDWCNAIEERLDYLYAHLQ